MSNTDKNRKERFLRAKRALFDKYYDFLNPEQRRAVFSVNGPLLILAGAGSGKTTVLVNRIAYIIKYGNAYESDEVPASLTEDEVRRLEEAVSCPKDVIEDILSEMICSPCPPYAMLAITFTNKAAKEMKDRLQKVIGDYASEIWAGTFHSMCVRLLRKFGERIGYRPGFTIYDTDDSKKLLLSCMKELDIDEKSFPVKSVQNEISRLKERLCPPDRFAAEAGSDYKLTRLSAIYALYQRKLRENNALDFDDLIMQTVRLLRQDDDARSYCQNRFRYLSVDEYQDTNIAQFELVRLLSDSYRNLMVVGDDDQSIYRFRGATIENILTFDKVYEDARVIKLEENYRSTSSILEAANAVISHNNGRHEKKLWTKREDGEKIVLQRLDNQTEEAKFVINKVIELMIREKRHYSDFAVLYRTNAQSNSLEQVFSRSGIPYRILGGTRFFDRKEIKDILAYLCLVNNPDDNLRLMRIINEPKRKIGDTTVSAIEQIASRSGGSMFAVMEEAERYPAICKNASKLKEFTYLIRGLQQVQESEPLHRLFEETISRSGYRQMLTEGGEEEKERLDNVNELISNAIEFESTHEEATLNDFLEETALISDIDKYDEEADAVVLMTIHSAKGLEFPVVFLPGCEEGIFPGMQAVLSTEELEEERRLAYVAITRAKDRLYFTHVKERLLYGRTQFNPISRFVEEVPEELLEPDPKRVQMQQSRNQRNRRSLMSKEFFSKSTLAADSVHSTGYDHLQAGDRVSHATFGDGTILSVKEMGADQLYEIAFDTCGTKKLMATYARLRRLDAESDE